MNNKLKKYSLLSDEPQLNHKERQSIESHDKIDNSGIFDKVSVTAPLRMNGVIADRDSFHNIRVSQQSYGNMATLRSQSISEIVQPGIQRKSADESDETYSDASPATAEQSLTPSEQTQVSTPGLIVDDSEMEPSPEQMRKSEFLSQLRTLVCSTAETALSGTIWSAVSCPWIDHWLGYYGNRDSVSIERAIRRYTPGAAEVTTAREYIPLICARVRSSIETWSRTGEVTGVPEGIPTDLPGGEGVLSGVTRIGGDLVGRVRNIIPGISFKGRESGARTNADPQLIQSKLGSGNPLDSNVRSKMGPVFGTDFSNVRVHTDASASELSNNLNARAFTIGRNIAFGTGEYRPGTPIGDALIAHELAHVVQQGGDGSSSTPMQKKDNITNSFENEADLSAVSAVAQIWGGLKDVVISKRAMPFLRTGLRLQRCEGCGSNRDRAEADRVFEQYRGIFNGHWNSPDFNGFSTAYQPTLSSNGPRTPRSRAIFERILNDHTAIRDTYNANTGGIKERIDSYIGPEGLNLIGSPRLTALQEVFNRHSRPVSASDYPAFKTAVQGAAANLDDQDRAAINLSNEWQRLINDYVRTDAQRAEIRGIITPRITPAASPPPVTSAPTPLTPAEQLSRFIRDWEPQITFWDGASQALYSPGSRVQYWGGRQNFSVGSSSSVDNPGQVMFVRARIMRGTDTAHEARTASFPSNQDRMAPMAMSIRAPRPVSSSSETLTFRLELLADDRTTVLKTRNVSMTVFPEVTYTQAQAENAANDDNNYFHDNTPTGLLGKMTAHGGIQANVAAAINDGHITLRPLTQRHDSSEYVYNSLGRYDPSTVGYFVGVNYSTSLVEVAGAAGFSLSSGNIVVNRTTNVATGEKKSDSRIIRMIVHEAVHAFDIRPDSGTDLELYKTEFRAYWMDGRFGPPDQGTCPTSATGCKSTAYDPSIPPPGPKSERANAIFDLLYSHEVTYPFVRPAYDNNTNGFRQAVDSYLIPDGINLIASLRLDALRDLIEDYGWTSRYWIFRLEVQARVSNLNNDEKNEITRNRAWRDLVERQVTNEQNQIEIKTIMGIPQ